MSQDHQHSPSQNPYASPAAVSLAPDSTAPEEVHIQELRVFVGRKHAFYLKKWEPWLRGKSKSTGINWWAFLLSSLWLPYRKMYRLTFILFAIITLESIAEEVVFVGMLGHREPPAFLQSVTSLTLAIICGAYGNRWYLDHARSIIAEARAAGLQDDALFQALAKRGGTSIGASIGMLVLFLVVLLLVYLPIQFFLYDE